MLVKIRLSLWMGSWKRYICLVQKELSECWKKANGAQFRFEKALASSLIQNSFKQHGGKFLEKTFSYKKWHKYHLQLTHFEKCFKPSVLWLTCGIKSYLESFTHFLTKEWSGEIVDQSDRCRQIDKVHFPVAHWNRLLKITSQLDETLWKVLIQNNIYQLCC